ncbi:MAG: restriction endonuclease [Nitrososphaerota archaeon]|jgi:hypothetical protein|nr:restriction endonuclease [Nitrososphaerota archaeon]
MPQTCQKGGLRINHKKFSGILKEIAEQPPDRDIADLLADKLQIPMDKAEELADRIKKTHNQTPETPYVRAVVEKLSKPAQQAGAYLVECLSDKELEIFMQWLFKTLGYEVSSIWLANGGADLVAIHNGEKVAVLAQKCPPNYALTDATVLAAQQAQNTHGCSRSIIITTACFTEQAVAAAQSCGVELWDRAILTAKIDEAKERAAQDNQQTSFPPYQGSLLLSLLMLAETKTFLIESKAEGKYDLFLPGIKYPLLTFETCNGIIMRCVFRIKYNEPVSEGDGEQVIRTDKSTNMQEPGDLEAYRLIIQYLSQFVE